MKTTELQDAMAARLAAAGFLGKWWGPGPAAERFYFDEATAALKKNGKPVRGSKVWLQFDEPATLEGASVHATAKKFWHKQVLAKTHAAAVLIAIELVDPERAAQLRQEIENAERVGDLVAGEDDN